MSQTEGNIVLKKSRETKHQIIKKVAVWSVACVLP